MSGLKWQHSTTSDSGIMAAPNEDTARPMRHDSNASTDVETSHQRSLFVHALPPSCDSQKLTALFSESFPLKHATVVVDPVSRLSKGYGFVTFADPDDAQNAKRTFHGLIVDGQQIKVELAKIRHRKRDSLNEEDGDLGRKAVDSGQSGQNSSKLIVRNLPWTIKTEDQLALLFRSYGKVKYATVPRKGPGLSAGFGFIVLRGRKNAEKAMAAVNGQMVDGRPLAVDWAVEKKTWRDLQQSADSTTVNESASNSESGIPLMDNKANGDRRSLQKSEENHLCVSNEMVKSRINGDPDSIDGHDDISTTLFIRNLPFTTTGDALYEHFSRFGSIRYSRVVVDPVTDRSKGTGFVCFYGLEEASGCLRGAPKVEPAGRSMVTEKGHIKALNSHSLLEDPMVDRSGAYTMSGRVLQLSWALDRHEATRLTHANNSLRDAQDKDKRRLYLLAEGAIHSDSPLSNELSAVDIQIREDSAKQRASLIKTNPSLHISLTRLSIRNLPRSVDSKALKALAREAAVKFAIEVKEGLRKQLTKEELSRGGEPMREAEQARKAKGRGIVKQAKVVFEGRDGNKVPEDSGAGRSRGYGFIEYSSHRWALMGLRWLNGHVVDPPTDSSTTTTPGKERKKCLIVEFAIENAIVVARRGEREAKARETSRIATEKKAKGEVMLRKADKTRDQLMAKTRKGSKRKRDSAGLEHDSHGSDIDGTRDLNADRLAKRQQIIGRKRMVRRSRGKMK